MKRLSMCMLFVLIFALFTTGCAAASGGDTSPGGSVILTIWHDKEEDVASVLAAELAQLEPEIVVYLERKSGLTETLKLVGNDSSNAPDMYFFAHDKVGIYSEMGILAPITDFVDMAALERFLPKTIEAATYGGSIYQLPLYFETLLFMYNRELMNDDEVPETTQDLFRFMQRNTGGGMFGFVEQYTNAYFTAGWIHGFGGELITSDGMPMLDSPETIEALRYHRRFIQMMPGEAEFATINTLFREGRAASTIGGPWLVPGIREAGIDLGLAKMPVVSETGMPLAPFMGVQGLHVLRVAAENEVRNEAIRVVLNHLVSTDIGVALAEASGSAPALAASFELDAVRNNEMAMMMYELASIAVPMPNIPEMDVMWVVASNLLVDINLRGQDVEDSAAAAQRRAEELIDLMR